MIHIIGLGVVSGDITLMGAEAVKAADVVFVKTARHPAADYISSIAKKTVFLDELYESADDFDQLNQSIVDKLLAECGKIAYCVPGSGSADVSVTLLNEKTDCKIIPGVDLVTRDIFVAMATEYAYLSATEFCERRKNLFDTNMALVLTECNDPYLAADVKLKLLELYGAGQPVYYMGEKITVKELDRKKLWTDGTVLVLPPVALTDKEQYTFGDLIEVIYRLRDPNGCQWDRAQTHMTIRGNAVEEAYELVEAIELDDIDKMREESGDVVLQGLFNAVIADASGEFSVGDMISELTKKLITRHTHIFGEHKANTTEEALLFWEQAKAKEKGYVSVSDKFDSIPKTFSALMGAYKAQKISAKIGFDFPNAESASSKVYEEMKELFAESDPILKEEEGGDLLFAVVNVLRHLGVDPELALNRAARKYITRVKRVEKMLTSMKKTLKECTADEFDDLWRRAKELE